MNNNITFPTTNPVRAFITTLFFRARLYRCQTPKTQNSIATLLTGTRKLLSPPIAPASCQDDPRFAFCWGSVGSLIMQIRTIVKGRTELKTARRSRRRWRRRCLDSQFSAVNTLAAFFLMQTRLVCRHALASRRGRTQYAEVESRKPAR